MILFFSFPSGLGEVGEWKNHCYYSEVQGQSWEGRDGLLSEPHGASFSWLHFACVSREWLQRGLQTWSRFKNLRLAGLQPEPLVELLVEPCQTGPKYYDGLLVGSYPT